MPTPQQAHETLVQALQEQASWEQRARTAKELLKELLTSRREAADLAAQYDTRYNSLFCSVVRLFLPLLSLRPSISMLTHPRRLPASGCHGSHVPLQGVPTWQLWDCRRD